MLCTIDASKQLHSYRHEDALPRRSTPKTKSNNSPYTPMTKVDARLGGIGTSVGKEVGGIVKTKQRDWRIVVVVIKAQSCPRKPNR